MILFFLRLVLTLIVLVLIYFESLVARGAALSISLMVILFSHTKFYSSRRDKILGLLGDKIFFSSVLVVLTDFNVLSVALSAWVIGVTFLHSGIDLLQGSLSSDSINFRSSWIKNCTHMLLCFIVLIIFSIRSLISYKYYSQSIVVISYAWFFLTVYFLLMSLISEKFRKLVKEA